MGFEYPLTFLSVLVCSSFQFLLCNITVIFLTESLVQYHVHSTSNIYCCRNIPWVAIPIKLCLKYSK